MSWKKIRTLNTGKYKTRMMATERQWAQRIQQIKDKGDTILDQGVLPFDPSDGTASNQKRYWALVQLKEAKDNGRQEKVVDRAGHEKAL